MKFYYTYVLRSIKDKKMYTGYTENLKVRFELHSQGKIDSTKNRRPFELIYYEAGRNKKDALKREKYLKTHLAEIGKMFLYNRLKSYLTGQAGFSRPPRSKPSTKAAREFL